MNYGFDRFDVIDTIRDRHDRAAEIARGLPTTAFRIVERPHMEEFFVMFEHPNGGFYAFAVGYDEIISYCKKNYFWF